MPVTRYVVFNDKTWNKIENVTAIDLVDVDVYDLSLNSNQFVETHDESPLNGTHPYVAIGYGSGAVKIYKPGDTVPATANLVTETLIFLSDAMVGIPPAALKKKDSIIKFTTTDTTTGTGYMYYRRSEVLGITNSQPA